MNLKNPGTLLCCLIITVGFTGCTTRQASVIQGPVTAYRDTIDLVRAGKQWQSIKAGDSSALQAYNRSVTMAVTQVALDMANRRTSSPRLRTPQGEVPLAIDFSGILDRPSIDRIIPVDSIEVKSGFPTHNRVNGIGAPLLLRQKWTPRDSFVATTGLWFPGTAILDLEDLDKPVLRFLDPTRLKNSIATANGVSIPLRADYTESLARDVIDREDQFAQLKGLFQYEKFSQHMGLYRISAFSPDKKPVVLVHGLNSTPGTWNETLNELLTDPVIRDQYEFWTFGYPTGAPIHFLSHQLRVEMNRMIEYRRDRGATRNRVSILSHSMGGLISKPLTQSSDDWLWKQTFNVPPGELRVSEKDRRTLTSMLIFEPIPEIERVVFLAVPHQGSPLAGGGIKGVTGMMIAAPQNLVGLSRNVVSGASQQMTPLGKKIVGKVPTSVSQLALESPSIQIFAPLPLNPAVEYHSIIGHQRGSVKDGTDGVVPYESSHLSGVTSEKVIRGNHNIHTEPGAIAEMVRILRG